MNEFYPLNQVDARKNFLRDKIAYFSELLN